MLQMTLRLLTCVTIIELKRCPYARPKGLAKARDALLALNSSILG